MNHHTTYGAIARWRLGLPMGELGDVDRAMVATLLSFGSPLEHDAATQAGLILLDRSAAILRRLLRSLDRASELQATRNAMASIADATKALRAIEPRPAKEVIPEAIATPVGPHRKRLPPPTPEEIAARCAEVQAGWSSGQRRSRAV